jgi:hypothetical protein
MKQKMHDGSDQTPDKVDATGDGVLKDKAAKTKELLSATEVKGDPRRRGEIVVKGQGSVKQFLYINDEMWAEVQWVPARRMWCIQDRCGYCHSHLEHKHAEVPNDGGMPDIVGIRSDSAIEKAKEMIRDGSMPSPEEAKAAFQKRHGFPYPH